MGATLRFWDPDSGELTDSIDEGACGVLEWQTFGAFDFVSVNVQMLSDGRLASWSFDTVRVWDPVLHRLLYSLKHGDEGVSEVLELPHLRRLVSRHPVERAGGYLEVTVICSKERLSPAHVR